MTNIERRKHPRISWNFVTKFRPKGQEDAHWEVPILENISEGGCFFYSSSPHAVGDMLEIEIQFPMLQEPMKFIGEVKRYKTDVHASQTRYGIGVQFLEMDEEKKKKFVETINFFLKKSAKRKSSSLNFKKRTKF